MPTPSLSQPDKIYYYVKLFNFKLQKVLSHGLVFLSPQASDYLYVLNTEFNLCMFKCLFYKSIYMSGLIFLQYFICKLANSYTMKREGELFWDFFFLFSFSFLFALTLIFNHRNCIIYNRNQSCAVSKSVCNYTDNQPKERV